MASSCKDENCFQCPRFLGKKAYIQTKLNLSEYLQLVMWRERAYLDNKERILLDRLEELAQEEVDERNEVLVRLLTWQGLLLRHDLLEQIQSRDLRYVSSGNREQRI